MSEAPLRIIELTAEHVKRLSAVTIRPDDGSVVVIAGENGAGKSSAIDAIMYVLGGEKCMPDRPWSDGHENGRIVLDLGEYIATRTQTPSGSKLTLASREGATFPRPQSVLDGLIGPLAFDPISFAGDTPANQAATLRALAHIDTTDINTRRKKASEERTLVNRDLKAAEGALSKAIHHDGVGSEPETSSTLDAEEAAITAATRAAAEASERRAVARTKADHLIAQERAATGKRDACLAALERAEAELDAASMASAVAHDALVEAERCEAEAKSRVPDAGDVSARRRALADRNAKAADNARHDTLRAERDAVKAASDKLSRIVEQCDAEKAEILASAVFPLEGLSLDGDVVLWRGLPLAQASTAEKIRVSVAIGLELSKNKRAKIALIRSGNDLDGKSLRAIAEQVQEAGGQVIIERIAGGDGLQTFVIEDGRVAS